MIHDHLVAMPQTQLDRFLTDSSRLTRNAQAATDAATAGAEMMAAAGQVVAARMDILAAGLADPARTDLKEIGLMSSEKVQAFSLSAQALLTGLDQAAGRATDLARTELAQAGRAVGALSRAATPAAVAQAQVDYVSGLWGRSVSAALTVGADMLKIQAEALRPIHAAATANARRLKP